MKRILFLAPARRELLDEVDFYNRREAGLGARFASAVEEAALRALAFPSTGSPASKTTRRVFVKDFPFALVYRAGEGGIVVIAVAHHARLPQYWQPRVQETRQAHY